MELRQRSEIEHLYQTYRGFLFGLAYRMTGCAADAEDVVQDVFLQLQHIEPYSVHHPKSYLAKMVHHKCLDLVKSARHRRESYVGQWLPEPVITAGWDAEPEALAIQGEMLSLALLTLLEQLNPMERAVFVLREAFDFSYAEIAGIVGRTEPNCRQTMSRIKRKLQPAQRSAHASEQLVKTFIDAVHKGNIDMLVESLAEGAVLYTDGGGKVRSAIHPIAGRDRIVQYLAGMLRKATTTDVRFELVPASINGEAGALCLMDGNLYGIIGIGVSDNVVANLYVIYNPDKLAYAARQLRGEGSEAGEEKPFR